MKKVLTQINTHRRICAPIKFDNKKLRVAEGC